MTFPRALPDRPIGITPLTAGWCRGLHSLTERGAPPRWHTYPSGFTLVHHPERGPVLFDTGYAPRVQAAMGRGIARVYGLLTPVHVSPADTAAAQLQTLGIHPHEVTAIILSHLHADHVGGLLDFPNADLILDERAYAAVRGKRGLSALRHAFIPELLPGDFDRRLRPLHFQPVDGLDGTADVADVFADGTVHAVPVPGHATGMIALTLCTTATDAFPLAGPLLLGSDVAWSTRALRRGTAPPRPATLVFDDPALERRSAAHAQTWLTAHPAARVLLSHDLTERPVHTRFHV